MTCAVSPSCTDLVSQSDRMIVRAMDALPDANEAYWLVHQSMMAAMSAGVDLDTAFAHALRKAA